MVGVGPEVTLIVRLFELAVVGLAQFALEVNTQVTACPFVKAEVLYAALLVPTLMPFTFH